ncbi:MAG: hypothetical protein OXH02_14440 [Gemmatimonadetes bacterium]|nr:hypothetical protein [Gemmatimonadota bacterium]
MSKIQVLVFDDSFEIAEGLAVKVRAACDNADVTAVEQTTFLDLVEELNQRRARWRDDVEDITSIKPLDVDEADVVIVDYDLLAYSDAGDITGSRLAYLLRCFTKCGLVIVLNEYGNNTFDMSLRSPSLNFADLHLGAEQIGNPGLWSDSFEGYRPWHWPVIPNARCNFEKCVKDVQENSDEPILEFLDLGRFIDWMPKRVHDFFLGSGNIESVLFSDFVERARGGTELKDHLPPDYMARVATARLLALLNGLILTEQSILVDAPHLVARFPSLIKDGNQDIHNWNRLCEPLNKEIDNLFIDEMKEYRFKKQHWLWRPVWFWPDISRDEQVAEVRDPWTVQDIDWVFCENISQFVPTALADDFRADVSPPFNKRFVFKSESPEALTFVSQAGSGGPQDPLLVEYVPQAAFSL